MDISVPSNLTTVDRWKAFGGTQLVLSHSSGVCRCPMTFGLFLPPQAEEGKVPVLWYLSGLTCNHENAMTKAGFQKMAAQYGLAIVFPDTSPRGETIADHEDYDLGQGAGFYLDAQLGPWSPNFSMESYVSRELRGIVESGFPVDIDRQGITGHSMGGHGALTLAMKHPKLYSSVSAFAPIVNPSRSEWGEKQFAAYLGPHAGTWRGHDACVLAKTNGWSRDILIDQGEADQFLHLLMPENFEKAAGEAGINLTLRRHSGYDHSYFFIASFAADHIIWHAERLSVMRED